VFYFTFFYLFAFSRVFTFQTWNKIDFCVYVIYWVATVFRVHATLPYASFSDDVLTSKLLYGIAIFFLYMRLFRFYMYSQLLGPKVRWSSSLPPVLL
jgi:hypothetical protein